MSPRLGLLTRNQAGLTRNLVLDAALWTGSGLGTGSEEGQPHPGILVRMDQYRRRRT